MLRRVIDLILCNCERPQWNVCHGIPICKDCEECDGENNVRGDASGSPLVSTSREDPGRQVPASSCFYSINRRGQRIYRPTPKRSSGSVGAAVRIRNELERAEQGNYLTNAWYSYINQRDIWELVGFEPERT